MGIATHLAILAASVAVFYVLAGILANRKLAALPPGPKGWPIIGNVLDVCPDDQHPGKFYQKHKDRYGKQACPFISLLP